MIVSLIINLFPKDIKITCLRVKKMEKDLKRLMINENYELSDETLLTLGRFYINVEEN